MMWMMGYNDGGDFDSIQDPFTSGRKLRPLMSRPSAAANPPSFSSIHGADFLALNHHLAAMAEQNKRELSTTQQVVVSTRWNPTPEQLQTLEEMYRRGTRTPSADQIQQITSQLRRYGKIEGKNVFYWFQNHKARERQKRRRQLESLSDEQPHHNNHQTENIEKRQEPPGANRRAIEMEQTKNWASLTNLSSTTTPEKTAQRAPGAADGWLQFDEDEDADMSQQRWNATSHMKHLSCSSSSPTINSAAASVNTCSATAIPPQEMQQQHHHQHSINIFLEPYYSPQHQNLEVYSAYHHGGGTAVVETQILQLFPLQSSGGHRQEEEEEAESGAAVDSVTPPYQFYEFLPLKN